ncbi:MAG: hypothetical protein AB7I50_11685 [Vicinamibacterales bacterium]
MRRVTISEPISFDDLRQLVPGRFRDLADGRWHQLSLAEQFGNIGSEISRAVRWSGRNEAMASGAYALAVRP